MNKLLLLLLFTSISVTSYAEDSITGKWRGTIIGHVDNKDYFINAEIAFLKKDEYTIRLKIFSGDYVGEFLLSTTFKNTNRLYINNFKKINEFPYPFKHIEDCFTGYFLIKKEGNNLAVLDLYRNPIYRNIIDFTDTDSAGNYIPSFECFTSVLLRSVKSDTTFSQLEKRTDSLVLIIKAEYKKCRSEKLFPLKSGR